MTYYVNGEPSENLQKLHRVHKELLVRFADFCAQQDLAWFLVAGSALGAVRDGDIIPWDDDLDIGMLREDFDRACRTLGQSPIPGTFLQDWRNEPGYPLPFAKLRLDDSRVEPPEFEGSSFHQGIFLDIFPYDPLPEGAAIRKVQRILLGLLNLLILPPNYDRAAPNRSAMRKTVQTLALPLRQILPKRPLIQLREALQKGLGSGTGEWRDCFGMFGIMSYRKTMMRLEELRPLRKGKLGDQEIFLPARAETHLERLYGNWRELPPAKKRKPGHIAKVVFPPQDG